MGKKDEKFEKESLALEKESKELERKKLKLMASCCHTKDNGNTYLKPTDTQEVFKCKRCGAIVDLRNFVENSSSDSIEHLKEIGSEFINAMNVLKHRASRDRDEDVNDEKIDEIIDYASKIILNVKAGMEFLEAYLSSTSKRNKDKKKKEKKESIGLGLSELGLMHKAKKEEKKKKKW